MSNTPEPACAAKSVTDCKGEPMSPYATLQHMAVAIVTVTKTNGGCLAQDLNAIGFSPDEVVENWRGAKALAAKMLGGAVSLQLSEGVYVEG